MSKKYKMVESQKVLFLFQLLNKKKSDLNVCGSITIKEKIDKDKLIKAINKFVEKNEAMRTRICFPGLGFKQYFAEYEPFDVEIVNVESEKDVIELENQIIHEAFSIINSQLFKIKIFMYKDGTGGFIGCIHHVICDSWTIGLAIDKIMDYYTDDKVDYECYPYSEHIEEETKYLKSNRYDKDKQYYKDLFEKSIPALSDIKGNLEIKDKSRKCGNASYIIPKEKMDIIVDFCKERKISVSSFFTGVYSYYVGERINSSELMLDIGISNRKNIKEKNTAGLFVKTLSFKATITKNDLFEYFKNIHNDLLKQYKHYQLPNREVLKIAKSINPDRKKLSNVGLSFQNTKTDKNTCKVKYDIRWVPIESTFVYDMLIEFYDLGNDGTLNIVYNYLKSKYSVEELDNIHNDILKIIDKINIYSKS